MQSQNNLAFSAKHAEIFAFLLVLKFLKYLKKHKMAYNKSFWIFLSRKKDISLWKNFNIENKAILQGL